MKILIVSPGRLPIPAVRGGAVETLIDLLLKYNEIHGQHDIWVAATWDEDAEAKASLYQHTQFFYVKRGKLTTFVFERHLVPYRVQDLIFTRQLVSRLTGKKIDFDCIVIENEFVNGWVMMKKINGNYIYHAHNDGLEAKHKRDCAFLKSCEKVITVSKHLGRSLRKKAVLSNLEIVYNGVDTELFQKEKYKRKAALKRKEYGLDPEDFVIAFAGRLVQEKGAQVLVEAVQMLPKEQKAVLLLIGSSFFGKNRDTPYIKKLRETCNSGDHRIIFTGYVEQKEMPVYYAMADVGCVPSLWDEPFGLTVAEQMSMELPIITTDSGAIPEIVDRTCGYLFPRDEKLSSHIASALIELKSDRGKCRAMGKRGREIVEQHFSCQVFCESWFRAVQIGERK